MAVREFFPSTISDKHSRHKSSALRRKFYYKGLVTSHQTAVCYGSLEQEGIVLAWL